MIWGKYTKYVEKHFRYIPQERHVIGSVPILWNEEDQVVKTLHLKMVKEQGVKQRLKYLLAEKLPSIWDSIPDDKKGA